MFAFDESPHTAHLILLTAGGYITHFDLSSINVTSSTVERQRTGPGEERRRSWWCGWYRSTAGACGKWSIRCVSDLFTFAWLPPHIATQPSAAEGRRLFRSLPVGDGMSMGRLHPVVHIPDALGEDMTSVDMIFPSPGSSALTKCNI